MKFNCNSHKIIKTSNIQTPLIYFLILAFESGPIGPPKNVSKFS